MKQSTGATNSKSPPLELNVIGVDIHQDIGRPYSTFIVQARYGTKIWTVEKRFSEFFAFDQHLRKLIGNSNILPPPLRKSFLLPGPQEIEHRKQLLNDYLHALSVFITSHTLGTNSVERSSDENAEKSYWSAVHSIYKFVRFVECSSSVEMVHSVQVYHVKLGDSPANVFKSTKVLMATPQVRRLGYTIVCRELVMCLFNKIIRKRV